MKIIDTLKKIRSIKSEAYTLKRAYMDPRTQPSIKFLIAALALVYIVSPVDIAPDILPFLGITDDVMIIPILMWIFIPNTIIDEARENVIKEQKNTPKEHHWFAWGFFGILLCSLIYILYLLIN